MLEVRRPIRIRIGTFLAFSLPFLIYFKTMAPTLLWSDSAKLTLYVYRMRLKFDIVASHMLHTLIGKLFSLLPFGDYAWRQNFMSVFFGAATTLVFFRMLLSLEIAVTPALVATGALALSHVFWHLSVINESYTLFSFFLFLLLFLSLQWQKNSNDTLLYLIGFLFGIGFCNHGILALFIPAFGYFLFSLRREKGIHFSQCLFFALSIFAGIAVIALTLFLIDPSSLRIDVGKRFLGEMKISFESFWVAVRELFRYPLYLFYQFPLAGFLLGFLGFTPLLRRNKPFLMMTVLIFFVNVLYTAPWWYQRKFFVLLESYLMFAIWMAAGLEEVFKKNRKVFIAFSLILILFPPLLYTVTPMVLDRFRISLFRARELTYRDNNRFFLTPDKSREWGAYRYGTEVLAGLPEESAILADFAPYEVLDYFQTVEKKRPDVILWTVDRYHRPERKEEFLRHVASQIDERPLFLADNEPNYYFLKDLQKTYHLVPWGIVYRLEKIRK